MPFITFPFPGTRPTFARRNLQPPSNLYIDRDDVLIQSTVNAWPSSEHILTGRILQLNGEVGVFRLQAPVTSDRVGVSSVWEIGEGWLLAAVCGMLGTAPSPGTAYTTLSVARGRPPAATNMQWLISAHVPYFGNPGWPPQFNVYPASIPGWMHEFTGTDPAAGVEISEQVPVNTTWRLIAVRATFTTDATVATRIPRLLIEDTVNVGVPIILAAPVGVTASTATDFVWTTVGYAQNGPGLVEVTGLPADLYMDSDKRFRTNTVALQAGDNWSAPEIYVEDWVTG